MSEAEEKLRIQSSKKVPTSEATEKKFKIHPTSNQPESKSESFFLESKLSQPILCNSSLPIAKNRGRWSDVENKRFQKAKSRYGNNWKQVAAFVRTRTPTQAKTHNQKISKSASNRRQKITTEINEDECEETSKKLKVDGKSKMAFEGDFTRVKISSDLVWKLRQFISIYFPDNKKIVTTEKAIVL